MSKVSRWERERSAWLLAHSRPGTTRRRRGELLARQARRLSRSGTSAGESALHDDATERRFRRLMKTEEGSVDRLARAILVPLGYALAWLIAGGAIIIAAAFYRGLWTLSPRVGRLWMWPWLVAGVAVGTVSWLVLDHGPVVDYSVWPRYLVIDIDWPRLATSWLWIQGSIALVLTGVRIWSEGWAAVPVHARVQSATNKDGTFKATPKRQKVRLDPFVSAELDEPAITPDLTTDLGEEIDFAIEQLATGDDLEPVFADEDDFPVYLDEDFNDIDIKEDS